MDQLHLILCVQKRKKKDILGGSCTYFAVAASFYSKVQVVAAVGSDFPKRHINMLKNHEIDLEGLEIKKVSKLSVGQELTQKT